MRKRTPQYERKRSGLRALAVASLSLALTVSACQEDVDEVAEVVRGVLTQEVQGPGASRLRSFSGLARSRNRTDLSFRVSGEIRKIHVRTGDTLEAGALVAELDPTDFEISLREARAALAQAEAEKRNAEANYKRMRSLYESEGVSRGDLDQARASAESSAANASAAENRVQQAARQLRYTTLRTPSEGAVSAVPADTSENVQAGEPVVVFQTGGPPEVEIAMPENLIPSVETGQVVQIAFGAFPDEPYQGVVREVGIAPAEGESTYPVTVQVQADWDKIRPGMAADVAFDFASSEGGLIVIPAGAVGHDRSGHFVYLVTLVAAGVDSGSQAGAQDSGVGTFGTTEKRSVVLGEISAEGLEIASGIRGGERIVVAGVPRIREGMRVRILHEGEWP